MKQLDPNEISFSRSSIIDDAGKVFFHGGEVFRAIYSREHAELYRKILQEPWMAEVFDAGLVNTSVATDISLPTAYLILKHETIPFETHPAESTNYLHWLAAKAIVSVSLRLAKQGLLLKDAHPWNIMFQKGKATVVDFGSITKADSIPFSWLEEFRKYFCVPLWIASTRWNAFALEYRRQHSNGFGIRVFENPILNRLLFRKIMGLRQSLSPPIEFFKCLDDWLDQHKPTSRQKEFWADYQQCGDNLDHLRPELPKQKFVHDILCQEKPGKVLDFAANKGYYSEMAARLGADVLACDYEEYCVDHCLTLAREKQLPITPALLDFCLPTPNFGLGLLGRNAYERFHSDIVLALGLVHHICITQRIPVEVFCEICMNYSNSGVILEYVDPSDKHVATWKRPTPENYSIEGISKFFSRKFPRVIQGEPMVDNGINRVMLFFGKEQSSRE